VHFDPGLGEADQLLLFDAQTSGGLLLSVSANKLERFMARAVEKSQPAWVIGEVVEGKGIFVNP
jgi:selenophosphate synthase